MKGCIVYYSLDGHTKKLAEEISRINNYDLMQIEPEKPFKYRGFLKILIGGMWAIRKKTPPIKPINGIENYDTILLGSPVWGGRITPYLRTFLTENKLSNKKIAVFASCGSGVGSFYDNIKELIPENSFGEFFWLPEKESLNVKKLEEFAKH